MSGHAVFLHVLNGLRQGWFAGCPSREPDPTGEQWPYSPGDEPDDEFRASYESGGMPAEAW